MTPPLFGLVLAGGRSARMGRDKALLEYRGRTQLERTMDLLADRVVRRYVSVRADQRDEPGRSAFPQIVDGREDLGPAAGILAALSAHPDAAWLVVACDLPLLDGASLDVLLARRRPEGLATAFRSSHDGLPEPLCAIWEPASRDPLEQYLASGRQCPRKFLILSGAAVELLEPRNPRALDNVNTPAEHGAVMNDLAPSRAVRVQYFAILREQAGRSEELVVSAARTPRELFAELRDRYRFSLDASQLRVAVNAEFGTWDQPLGVDDTIVFIPPVAGG